MRLFAIGDIHGCSIALERLVHAISLVPGDRVVTLGDYLNKGPDTRGVFNQLIQLHRGGWLVPLRGNHELKLLEAKSSGSPVVAGRILVDSYTLASYGRGFRTGRLGDIPEAHWRFVREQCLDWWESKDHIFAHASVTADKPLAEQSSHALFWHKFSSPSPHMSGKTLVCGHTPQTSGYPISVGHSVCIDTWACGRGWLTCLEVTSGDIWQANQQGSLRRSHLREHYQGGDKHEYARRGHGTPPSERASGPSPLFPQGAVPQIQR